MVLVFDELPIFSDPITKSQTVSLIAFRPETSKGAICETKKGHRTVEGDCLSAKQGRTKTFLRTREGTRQLERCSVSDNPAARFDKNSGHIRNRQAADAVPEVHPLNVATDVSHGAVPPAQAIEQAIYRGPAVTPVRPAAVIVLR
jgi:hypothetical protein